MVRKKTRKPVWYAKDKWVWYAREWLAHKNLRQADVVSRTPFNKGQVSDYINRRRRLNEDVLVIFAEAIGIEPADLLRPPYAVKNELEAYVLALPQKEHQRVLKVLQAMIGEKAA